MSCGVGHRCCSDPVLLWLWHRLAATALIWLLAWEPPYAVGVVLKEQKKEQQQKKKKIIWVPLCHSRLRIRHCHCSSWGHCSRVGLILAWDFHMLQAQKKKKKKKKKILYYLFRVTQSYVVKCFANYFLIFSFSFNNSASERISVLKKISNKWLKCEVYIWISLPFTIQFSDSIIYYLLV